jgi:hypothetical protein
VVTELPAGSYRDALFLNQFDHQIWTIDEAVAVKDLSSRHGVAFPFDQSSSSSRFIAGASGFLNLSQSLDRPER